ncbi:uncharacterized protein DUF998 [Terracoccus luteus]|uniref:Uncharacterized protein DUF998 n=1 Tax=Terracoccus luteus TaxID=53356 RepID=A0A495XZ85_9MICO|nr:DUF998 domain-containing protein [Terracoccus luteus]RKT79920.1 uncharacterized protein DUF998 [Terracoccus luteus]
MATREGIGRACWSVQPLYVVAELVVAAAAVGASAYSLLGDTVSDLGASACTTSLCSPWHPAMNVVFIVFSLVRVVGAVALRPSWRDVATWAWVLSGLSAAAVGLAPVDRMPTAHVLVATPVFVLQPLALMLTARRLAPTHPRVGRAGMVLAVVTALAAVAFLLAASGAPDPGTSLSGALERLALWPVYLWLGLAARSVTVGPHVCSRAGRAGRAGS